MPSARRPAAGSASQRYRATDDAPSGGEWPVGIYWSPGEVRDVAADYPGADGSGARGPRPAWLVRADMPAEVRSTDGEG